MAVTLCVVVAGALIASAFVALGLAVLDARHAPGWLDRWSEPGPPEETEGWWP